MSKQFQVMIECPFNSEVAAVVHQDGHGTLAYVPLYRFDGPKNGVRLSRILTGLGAHESEVATHISWVSKALEKLGSKAEGILVD